MIVRGFPSLLVLLRVEMWVVGCGDWRGEFSRPPRRFRTAPDPLRRLCSFVPTPRTGTPRRARAINSITYNRILVVENIRPLRVRYRRTARAELTESVDIPYRLGHQTTRVTMTCMSARHDGASTDTHVTQGARRPRRQTAQRSHADAWRSSPPWSSSSPSTRRHIAPTLQSSWPAARRPLPLLMPRGRSRPG